MGDSENVCWNCDSASDEDGALVMLLQTSIAKVSRANETSCISLASRVAFVFVMSMMVLLLFRLTRFEPGKAKEKVLSANERNAHFDNAKFFCLALVIFDHWALWSSGYMTDASLEHDDESFIGTSLTQLSDALEKTFWFHMPLFSMLSGVVSGSLTKARLIRMIVSLVVPFCFVVFLIEPIAMSVIKGQTIIFAAPSSILMQSGPGPLWYMRCLFFWRLLFWLFESISPSPSVHMLFAILIGVCGVYSDNVDSYGPTLGKCALVRTACMAPFFFAGRWIDWNWLSDKIPAMPRSMIFANWSFLLVLCGIIQTFHLQYDRATSEIENQVAPFASYMYIQSTCPADVYFHWARYLVDLCFRGVLAVAFLYGCVPREESFITDIGANTMYAYVLHCYFLQSNLVIQMGKLYVAVFPHAPSFCVQMVVNAAGILASCAFTYILSSRLTRILLGWALQPTWLLPWLLPSKGSDDLSVK